MLLAFFRLDRRPMPMPIQSLFAGLILAHIVSQNRRDFEYRFNLVNRHVKPDEPEKGSR